MKKALVVVGLGVAAAVPVYLVQPVFQGIETAAPDRSGLSASDLVAQSTTVTQYLVTLATGIFALVGLLLTDKAGRALRSERASKLLILGCVLTGLSLWTGFLSLWVVLQLGRDETVRVGLDYLLRLHLVQLAELAVGIALIAGVFLTGIWHRHEREGRASGDHAALVPTLSLGRRSYDVKRADMVRRALDESAGPDG